jgi:hypothetical protein
MKRIAVILFPFLLAGLISKAQLTRYLVKFTNKGNNPSSIANPSSYLSSRAMARRTKYSIVIDSLDLPVTPGYINQVKAIPNVTFLNVSKWLNEVAIQTTDANAINAINNLPFVQGVSGIASRKINSTEKKMPVEGVFTINEKVQKVTGNYYDYGANSQNEIRIHHGELLHNIGLRGDNMQIAIIDAGFFNFNTYKAFDSININGQVLDTWDFVARESSVAEDYPHGMSCLSTIAANIPGQFVGMAPKASFYLFRTEDVSSEYPIEEFNWVCAAERADSSGADVISSSLGYTTFDDPSLNHTYADLNGHTTMAAIGAGFAAKKGMLVFIGAGNEGSSSWHYIMTPADADSVLTVGAVGIDSVRGSFSSFGPTSDGRIKPDVMSVGVNAVIETSANTIGASNGTSYACPKMAGLGTCLWQAFPEFNNLKIINAIRKSGNLASQPNDSLGYGIPDMKLAFGTLLRESSTAEISVSNCTATISWTSKDIGSMTYEIDRKTAGDAAFVKVGEVNATPGTILSAHSYQFIDPITGADAGTAYYTVKQIVDTSAEEYTTVYLDTLPATLANSCGVVPPVDSTIKITVAPNPVLKDITLIVQTPGAMPSLLIKIYDMEGRLMLQQRGSKPAGRVIFSIPALRLVRGKYTLVVYNGPSKIAAIHILIL